jgi:hypothetical protein
MTIAALAERQAALMTEIDDLKDRRSDNEIRSEVTVGSGVDER